MFANSAVLIDGTLTPSAGTSTDLLTLGSPSQNVHSLFLDDGSDYLLQKKFVAQYTDARVQASAANGYTQIRNSVRTLWPIVPTDRNLTVNSIKTEMAIDPYTTSAQNLSLRIAHAQLLFATAYEEFWLNRSLA